MVIDSLTVPVHLDQVLPIVVLYISPDAMLPLASSLAAIIGVLLLVWHRVVGLVRRAWRFCFSKSQAGSKQ